MYYSSPKTTKQTKTENRNKKEKKTNETKTNQTKVIQQQEKQTNKNKKNTPKTSKQTNKKAMLRWFSVKPHIILYKVLIWTRYLLLFIWFSAKTKGCSDFLWSCITLFIRFSAMTKSCCDLLPSCILYYTKYLFETPRLTMRIFEKLTSFSSVKLGVPSSMKDRSVRYIPR